MGLVLYFSGYKKIKGYNEWDIIGDYQNPGKHTFPSQDRIQELGTKFLGAGKLVGAQTQSFYLTLRILPKMDGKKIRALADVIIAETQTNL